MEVKYELFDFPLIYVELKFVFDSPFSDVKVNI